MHTHSATLHCLRILTLALMGFAGCADEPDAYRIRADRLYAPTPTGGAGADIVSPEDTTAPDIAPDVPEIGRDDGVSDTVSDDVASPADTTAPADTTPTIETVDVSHAREFRAVWVATVWNINFPSRSGLSVSQLRTELQRLVDITAEAGLNAIVFQVRAEADAFYASTIEPWSRFLTGTQGRDPGLDPLAELIVMAHAKNIEVHAWLNPYRAKTLLSSTLAANHIAAVVPEYAYTYGSLLWLDPGAVPVQQRLLDVVADIVSRYDVDGIHFDDYFYPYPDGPFPDDATYQAYSAAGGTLSRDDWRRDNVNRMVGAVHARVRDIDPTCRFGIAPFGIYRPGQPEGIRGLDQYAAIFADPVRWMRDGHVDYIAPQLYWPTTQTQQAYEPLLRWWTEVQPGTMVLAGNYLSQLATSDKWTINEFREQLRISRAWRSGQSLGNIWYQIKPLVDNQLGIRDIFGTEFYPTPALTPPMPTAQGIVVSLPDVSASKVGVETIIDIAHTTTHPVRAAVIYRENGNTWVVEGVLPAGSTRWTSREAGPWAVTTVTRHGAESRGVVVD
jgi:uncharacterized lipoprotein YddW (UPF0748 family)